MATATSAIEPSVKISANKLLINGKWVDAASGKTFPTINPSTGEVITRVAEADAADVDKAVAAARAAFDKGPWRRKMTASHRGVLMNKLADLVEKHAEELAQLEALDNGKPYHVALAADLPLTIACYRYYAGWADKIQGKTIPVQGRYFTYTKHEPVGVVGQIIPWNFPLLMASWKLGPALACGNTVILKPAEQTPVTALRLGELILEAGLPEGVVNIITGFGPGAGSSISEHPDIDKVAFTGSAEVGKIILKASAGNLKRVSLELGGKSPNIIFPDADMEQAVPNSMMGVFFNSGQVCCAGTRIFVQKDVYDKFNDSLAKFSAGMTVGDGLEPSTMMGPLVSKEQFDKVKGYLELGKQEGARVTVGGEAMGGKGYFVKPTVFADVNNKMRIAREEIFGPVAATIPFKDENDAVLQGNDTDYGLGAAVWTSDVGRAHKVARALKAGTVWVNCYGMIDPISPFGGYKQSGFGRELGKYAIELYTQIKSVYVKL